MPRRRSAGDGGLYYLPARALWRGTLEAGYRPDGSRRTLMVHARTQKACREKLEALRREVATHGGPIDRRATMASWSEHWLDSVAKPSVDPKTYTAYAAHVKRIVALLGRKPVAQVRPSDVRALRETMVGQGLSSTTALRAYRVLSMILEAARAEGLCERNVAADVKPPTPAPVARNALSTGEAVAILRAAAGHPDGSRWWFKLLTGVRQGELLGATWGAVDWDRGTYTVDWKLEELTREHGCGPRAAGSWPCGARRGAACPQARWRIPDGYDLRPLTGRWHLTRPKSTRTAPVPLVPQLVAALERWRTASAGAPNPNGLIWPGPDGGPITPRADAQAWRDLLVEAGVIDASQAAARSGAPDGHCARHTTVTILASLGVDMQVIGQIVGHSSVEVTRIYRHADDAERRAAMEALGGAVAAGLIDA